ncbi:11298_t:CDS:2 [Dentiscutata heterogama]|uniref:11298_t:CDS:1 n=1 Tax=Dentiscutata heterogama TaxID=1316150 RepID=A0ACA9MWR3_9GLOM|nr:11298_t:CDS:2 [Dentiscutata heterogama]
MTTHRVGGENISNEQNLEENPMSSYLPLPNLIFTGIIDESDFIFVFSNYIRISSGTTDPEWNNLFNSIFWEISWQEKIGGIISRKLTPEEKDSKFIKEETTSSLRLTIIPSIFISNIKNNTCLSNKKSIMIPTEVLIEKSNSKIPNYILLGNNWFYGRKYNNDKLQTYIPEIVIDTEDTFVKTTLHIKDLNGSGVSKTENSQEL